jgi:Putative zinc-finger
MNHPKPEEWAPYVFGETNAEVRRRLHQHLKSCPECQVLVQDWKRSLGRLDAWKLPRRARFGQVLSPLLKWAAATAVVLVLGVGFALGRLAGPKADPQAVRAVIEPQIRLELQRELAALLRRELAQTTTTTLTAAGEQSKDLLLNYARALESKRAEENQALLAALDKLNQQRLADVVSLKKDIDTIALNTDAGLRQTERQLVQLADYTSPGRPPNPSDK